MRPPNVINVNSLWSSRSDQVGGTNSYHLFRFNQGRLMRTAQHNRLRFAGWRAVAAPTWLAELGRKAMISVAYLLTFGGICLLLCASSFVIDLF